MLALFDSNDAWIQKKGCEEFSNMSVVGPEAT